jgi:hypothetical protein
MGEITGYVICNADVAVYSIDLVFAVLTKKEDGSQLSRARPTHSRQECARINQTRLYFVVGITSPQREQTPLSRL